MRIPAILTCAYYLGFGLTNAQASSPPQVTVSNGTYTGVYQPTYNQDLFLGVRYAQPPVGQLRLARPQPLNTTFTGIQNATQYFPECVGYGGDQLGYPVSEDCLVVNVVRPSGTQNQSLPVGVWIHGGGYIMGGASDLRYNLSFIVQNSVKIGKPIIAVSMAYRLSGWGFLDSQEIRDAGVTNLGIRDQRLALRWIQENIPAFGGDPRKVTIWGESAGAGSVGVHLIAYGGRDDNLFRGAIAESGGPILLGPAYNVSTGQVTYDNITRVTNCASSNNTLQCLRTLDFTTLNNALNITPSYDFFPYNDNDLIQGSQYDQLLNGNFIRVPFLHGANTDEGTAFAPQPVDNTTAFETYLNSTGFNYDPSIRTLELLYPDIPALGIPQTYTTTLPPPAFGAQFKRAAAFSGDYTFIAARRLACQQWSHYNVTAYCYRFNVPVTYDLGATHFQEVAFVFNNLDGLGYRGMNIFTDAPPLYAQLSQLMSTMWAAFIHDGDPNGHGNVTGEPVESWPKYDNGVGGYGRDFLFDANVTSRSEEDTYRGAAIAYLNTLWKQIGK